MQHALTANAFRVWRLYERQLRQRPVRTQMTTSALLWGLGDVFAQKVGEKSSTIDRRRVAVTAAFGACFMGPVGHFWYLGLDKYCARVFPYGSKRFMAAKVALDSAVLGPLYILAFYAWGAAFIDGTGLPGFKDKISRDFIPTFCAEMCIWPAFQTLNFTRVPVQHQLLAVNVMSLLDASFLSWARNEEDWVATLQSALKVKQPSSH